MARSKSNLTISHLIADLPIADLISNWQLEIGNDGSKVIHILSNDSRTLATSRGNLPDGA
jgi:hypothetical protein